MERKNRFEALDSLRGISSLMVVILHSYWSHSLYSFNLIRNSYLFVDLFFILSGFVIALNYFEKILDGNVSIWFFMKKRFFRLWPLHLTMLFVFVFYEIIKFLAGSFFAVHGTFGVFTHNNLRAFVTNIMMLQSFNIHDEATFNGPSWSISVEFYTYLFFAFSLFCFRRYTKWYKWFVGLVIVSSALFLVFVVGHLSVSIDFGFLRCLLGFYCGIVSYKIYTRLNQNRFVQNFSGSLWSITEFIVIGLLLGIMIVKPRIDLLDFAVFGGGFALITLMVFSKGIVAKLFKSKYFVFLGKISFSLYMVHFLFSSIIKNALKLVYNSDFILDSWGGYIQVPLIPANIALLGYIVVSILAAIVLHEQVENRFRMAKSNFTRKS